MAESSGRGTERNRLFRSFHNNYHTIQLYNTSHTVSQIITSYHRNQLNKLRAVPTTQILIITNRIKYCLMFLRPLFVDPSGYRCQWQDLQVTMALELVRGQRP
ncbi:hypothetical protein Hanom_Chr12g01097691 [Helianthus anomalus]